MLSRQKPDHLTCFCLRSQFLPLRASSFCGEAVAESIVVTKRLRTAFSAIDTSQTSCTCRMILQPNLHEM